MQQHDSLALMERILKYSRDRDFFKSLPSLLEEYKESLLRADSLLGEDYWYAIYLVSVTISAKHGHSEEEVANLFANKLTLPYTKDSIMNIRQALREEALQEGIQQGMQQGIQQGMQQEKLEIAKNMLFQLHLGMDIVQKATSLSREELEQIQAEEK